MISEHKKAAELAHWTRELDNYVAWYEGRLPSLWGRLAPTESQKRPGSTLLLRALETWLYEWQRPKYLYDLELHADAYVGKTLVDIGCGPFPNISCFEGCKGIGVDALIPEYQKAGYPIQHWSDRFGIRYCGEAAETTSIKDSSVDAVISVNALDHVDNVAEVAATITRILKPGGEVRFHVHYHKATRCEPVELNDEIMRSLFSGIKGFTKYWEQQTKDMGQYTAPAGESFALWGNR